MTPSLHAGPVRMSRAGIAATFLATLVTGFAQAASFPDFPLQTGTGSIPANILFVLDDSGSMAWDFMPGAYAGDNAAINSKTAPVAIGLRTAVHNSLYYNPAVTYLPWMKADGNRYVGGTSLSEVFDHDALPATPMDLFAQSASLRTFYVPISAAADTSQTSSFYRYQFLQMGGGLRLIRSVYAQKSTTALGLAGAGCDTGNDASFGWRGCMDATPASRSLSEEATNFATWYSYFRTRTKAAKAGASDAFGSLGENFRVGYDSIWNRNGATGGAGTQPALPIPVGVDGGLFRGANKTAWFDYLQRAIASDGTPMHGALRRAGNYYETQTGASGPWGPQAGADQLSCRQSYVIMTTDGYWNSGGGYGTSGTVVGNSDNTAGTPIVSADGQKTYTYTPTSAFRDTYSETLADIAMHYWKRDLRTTLGNNVPASNADPAFWQHMVTFGISIGLKGSLDPDNDVPLIAAGQKTWPNAWNGTTWNWGGEGVWRIDDLLHATVNGRGKFVAASNPQVFAKALKDSLSAIQRRRASGSNVASNGPVLSAGSRLFQATYTSGEWSGDLSSVSIVGGSIAPSSAWSMSAVAESDPRPFQNRPILTWNGTAGAAFPTALQSPQLARVAGPAPVTPAANLAYIKGVRTAEKQQGGTLRDRTSAIGDIVDSSPFYQKETDSLYIGANDGMLHAVNAADGTVLFSYVPAGIDFAALASLSDPDYQHRFFVDGGMDVTTRAQGMGKNILVASLGRGGRGVFGLDVTDPAAVTNASSAVVLFDQTGLAAPSEMGYVLGAPLVRKANNGSTVVMVGNGVDSPNGKAVLYIYVLGADGKPSGSPIAIDTRADGANGLSEPRAADVDLDGDVDYVYAGDLKGNLWKFDLSDSNTNKWAVAYKSGSTPRPMFVATDASGNPQPITAAVALARDPDNNDIFVMFGTGRYISNGDLTTTSTQTTYSLRDEGAVIAGRGALTTRTIAFVGTDTLGRPARAWQEYSPLPSGSKGWYVDLGQPTPGERVVTAPFVTGRALWFSSIIPRVGSGCDSGGTGFLNAIDAFTGTNPRSGTQTYSYFDINSDGKGNDRLAGATGSGNDKFIGSVDLGVGMTGRGTAVGNNVYACGSEAECGRVPTTPPGSAAARLSWRELINRN